jgi:hypothetical protein
VSFPLLAMARIPRPVRVCVCEREGDGQHIYIRSHIYCHTHIRKHNLTHTHTCIPECVSELWNSSAKGRVPHALLPPLGGSLPFGAPPCSVTRKYNHVDSHKIHSQALHNPLPLPHLHPIYTHSYTHTHTCIMNSGMTRWKIVPSYSPLCASSTKLCTV